jgi:adenylate cyclase
VVQTSTQLTALHGDAVGYSQLIAENEIEARNTLQSHRRLFEAGVGNTGGDVVQFIGDEFLAIFPNAAAGVGAAIQIQRSLAEANAVLPEGKKMRFRLGVNSGAVSEGTDGWHGEGINVAARLQALSPVGGIYVSRTSLDQAGDIDVLIEPKGPTRLKNIPDPVHIFSLVDETIDSQVSVSWRRRVAPSNRTSLAVSPFVNLGDESDSFFSDGMVMNLTVSLTQLPGVDVVATESAFSYRDQPFSAQQIGHELGVKYVLEGATQRSGSKVRVMVQLVDVETGQSIWANKFNSSIEDLFDAQDEIVAAVVAALDIEVIGGPVAELHRSDVSSEAVVLIYKGLQHMSHATPDSLRKASESFERVIELEPEVPNGYRLAGLSHLMATQAFAGEAKAAHMTLAEERATRALELGEGSGVSLAVLAQIRIYQKDWDGALQLAEEATALRPSCDLAYGVAANVMRYLGRWEESVEYAKRATRLSPLFSRWYESIRANAEWIGGNFSEAALIAEGVLAEEESEMEALLTLAAAQESLGHDRHASATLKHAVKARPGLTVETLKEDYPYQNEEILSDFIAKLQAAGLK